MEVIHSYETLVPKSLHGITTQDHSRHIHSCDSLKPQITNVITSTKCKRHHFRLIFISENMVHDHILEQALHIKYFGCDVR